MTFDAFDERLYTKKLTEAIQSDYGSEIPGVEDLNRDMLTKIQDLVSKVCDEYNAASPEAKRRLHSGYNLAMAILHSQLFSLNKYIDADHAVKYREGPLG